ncbi:MAG: hypothetical protein F4X98_07765 [Gammaproteobacteria bacterium]|nr:hypothetical protein [Gammaproteobacteria bacterium]
MSPTRRPWLNVAFYPRVSLRVSAALVVLSSATDITATEPDDAAQLNELAESVDHPAWELAVRERAYRAAHESEHAAVVRVT